MIVLVVGASGATGRHLVKHLLDRGVEVRAVVRSPEKFPEELTSNVRLKLIKAAILDLTQEDLLQYVKDCDAVASCLGHNVTFKGMYGKPRRLVTEAVIRLCDAIRSDHSGKQVKFVLMNTSGNRDRDLNEKISMGQRMIIALLRLILPPHVDNEQAAEYLRVTIGQNDPAIGWVAVRPDGLIDADEVTEYVTPPSPVRNAIFNPGKVSRINVAHFMAELITNEDVWEKWKGRMPMVYGKEYVE